MNSQLIQKLDEIEAKANDAIQAMLIDDERMDIFRYSIEPEDALKLTQALRTAVEAMNKYSKSHGIGHTMGFEQCDGCDVGNALDSITALYAEKGAK